MKKIMLIMFATSMFVSCEQAITVQFDDSKSQTILNAYDWYMSNDMKSIEEIYSQDAYVFANSVDSITIKENMKGLSMHHELFKDINLTWGDGDNQRTAFVQTSTYSPGDITLAWFTWKGTGKASGKTYEVPTHIVYFWGDDNKINSASVFNDSASFNEELSFIESASEE